MAYNITHIYRIDVSNNGIPKCTQWVYARNADIAKAYCKEYFKKKHLSFNHYKAVMVGDNKNYASQDPSFLSEEEVRFIETTYLKSGDRYSYRRD